jgi:predicted SAM-dependent methyltransferase
VKGDGLADSSDLRFTTRRLAPTTSSGGQAAAEPEPRRVLNIGSGPAGLDRLHSVFHEAGAWREVRLDVDPRVAPDILCSVIDMGEKVQPGSFDAVWSSHTLEHLYDHEVVLALAQFRRALAKGGFALIRCPDLQAVIDAARSDGLETVAYVSPAGPITPLDMMFGFRRAIAGGNTFMAHKTGFTDLRLGRMLIEAGFAEVRTQSLHFDLWAVAVTETRSMSGVLKRLAATGLDFKDS